MRIAIQQPYFFPYPGYFKLIAQVDVVVLLTDVQYIRRGWVNRNRIPMRVNSHEWNYIRIPVSHAPVSEKINAIKVAKEQDWKTSLFNKLRSRYGEKGLEIANDWGLEDLASCDAELLLPYLKCTLKATMDKLALSAKVLDSASLELTPEFESGHIKSNGTSEIIKICKALDCSEYWNLSGGSELYNEKDFEEHNISLNFVKQTDFDNCKLDSWSVLHAICLGQHSKLTPPQSSHQL
jgi:hypothetical protein